MAPQAIAPINFTISPSAWTEIDTIRAEYDAKFPEKADVIMIGWGTTMFHSGESIDGVVVGYYNTAERRHIAHGIQRLDGREVVFFATSETAAKFDGKTIYFERNRGFYLN